MSLRDLIGPLMIVLPVALALPAAYIVMRALRPGGMRMLRQLDHRLVQRFNFLGWLVLSGLFIMAFQQLLQVIGGTYRVTRGGMPFLVPDISPIHATSLTYQFVVQPLVWVVLVLFVLWQLKGRGRQAIESATGWWPNAWQLLLLALIAAGLMMWPLDLPAMIGSFVTAFVRDGAVEIDRELLRAGWPRLFVTLGTVVGYLIGATVAWRLVRATKRSADSDQRAFGRVQTAALWLILAGVLSVGIEQLLMLAAGTVYLGSDVIEGLRNGTADVATRAQLVNVLLPILAYPMAADGVAALDWDGLRGRLGLRSLRVERLLVLLTVALWMSWLFKLPEFVTNLAYNRSGLQPEWTVLGTGAAVVLVWVGYQMYFSDPGR